MTGAIDVDLEDGDEAQDDNEAQGQDEAGTGDEAKAEATVAVTAAKVKSRGSFRRTSQSPFSQGQYLWHEALEPNAYPR